MIPRFLMTNIYKADVVPSGTPKRQNKGDTNFAVVKVALYLYPCGVEHQVLLLVICQ